VANQLLATLALCVGTVYILKHNEKKYYCLITFIPALFMFATTMVAGIINITLALLSVNLYKEIGISASVLITEIFVTVSMFCYLRHKGVDVLWGLLKNEG